jgi:hypothetical protein
MNGLPVKKTLEGVPNVKVFIGTGQKRCSKCKEVKPLNEFHKRLDAPDGHRARCKACENARIQKRYEENKEKIREARRKWWEEHREERNEYAKKWRLTNKEWVREREKKWRENNKDKIRKNSRRYYLAHIDEMLEKHREYQERRQKNNTEEVREYRRKMSRKIRSTPKGKINNTMSRSIAEALKSGSKAGRRWETLVDFTAEQLRKHLEKRFKDGMTWESYGKDGWHIDHIIPISVFNFESPEDIDFKRCWALKNLQPMWAEENMAKGNKLNKSVQPSLLLGS